MASIECSATQTRRIAAPIDAVLRALIDIPVYGKLWDDVETVTDLGDDKYRYRLIERKTAGIKFVGQYTCRYTNNGTDEMKWTTLEGNMDSRGSWRLTADGDGTRAHLEVISTITMPVPKLILRGVRIFAEKEMVEAVNSHIANVDRHVTSS